MTPDPKQLAREMAEKCAELIQAVVDDCKIGIEDEQEHFKSIILRELNLEQLLADKQRLEGLRALMGYIEAGEDTVVTLFQDDATKSYFVKVGKQSYFGDSFRQAIDNAMKSQS